MSRGSVEAAKSGLQFAIRPLPSLPAPRPQPPRRGVLLLVVLSMLVLFMLIGTAFLMSSGQSRDQAKTAAKADRLGNHATKLLDRGLLQVLRDTETPTRSSATTACSATSTAPTAFRALFTAQNADVTTRPARLATLACQRTRDGIPPLGPTQGQFIDIYVRALAGTRPQRRHRSTIRYTAANDESGGSTQLLFPDLRHMSEARAQRAGPAAAHTLPLTKGYYNGCLLTITSGPASGQTARFVGLRIHRTIPIQRQPRRRLHGLTRLFRFRVMAFQRTDGQPLQIGTGTRSPELTDLAGATFIVNGRPSAARAWVTTRWLDRPGSSTRCRSFKLAAERRRRRNCLIAECNLSQCFRRLVRAMRPRPRGDDGDSQVDEPDEANPFLTPFATAVFTPLNTRLFKDTPASSAPATPTNRTMRPTSRTCSSRCKR